MRVQDIESDLQLRVIEAAAKNQPLQICGGKTKRFYGHPPDGAELEVSGHSGIISYEPSELVLTARAGTPLAEIEAVLAAEGQMLGFEPPAFGAAATLGGTIACNFSGPRRAYSGSARDFTLGCRTLNGKGDVLNFGGQVMKNVAGYDVSRLMAGSLGTLGVLLEISLKVLPKPDQEITLVQETNAATALDRMHTWSRLPLPVSATLFDGERLYVRLSGAASAVRACAEKIGGERVPDDGRFWQSVKEQSHHFFDGTQYLWRLSLASNQAPLDLPGQWLYEWGGAQRWLRSDLDDITIANAASVAGGHAALFKHQAERSFRFQPLDAGLMALHQRLKHAFDPHRILNPGRLYSDL